MCGQETSDEGKAKELQFVFVMTEKKALRKCWLENVGVKSEEGIVKMLA